MTGNAPRRPTAEMVAESKRLCGELQPLARKYGQSVVAISLAYYAVDAPSEADIPARLRKAMVKGGIPLDRAEELLDDLWAVMRRRARR
jgi:hypothetical protein